MIMETVIRPETEMKDSGIDTVEKMPLSWSKIRLKNLVKIRTGNEDTQNATPNGKYRFYVRSPIVERCDRYTFEGEAILVAGDGAGAGRIFHLVNGRYAVHQRVYCLSDFKYNAKFVHYYLENLFPFEMDKGSAQSTVPSMRLPMLLNFNLVLPGENECLKIVDYLDEACSKIDEIIAEAKESIDEYKKLKQSVLFEAVTKGLDKNVEMKDSGIEWIGEMPDSWNIRMLNQYVSQVKCKNSDLSETNLLSLSYGKIKRKDINSNGGLLPESFDNYNIVDENDIVLRLTDLQNDHKSLRVGLVTERGIITSAYVTIRPKKINAAYLALLLHAFDYKKGFYGMGSGIRQGLTFDGVKSLKIVVPSVFEQDDIVKHVMKMTDKCDSLIAEKESLIKDLESYKKSLIYEVVTGKRRVV